MIDLENLTLKQIKEIAAMFPALNLPEKTGSIENPMIGRHCVVRTYSAGVFIGTLEALHGTEVLLSKARRLWRWNGAFTLSEVATTGIDSKESRMSCESQVFLSQAIEIILTTEEARRTFDECHE